MPNSNHNPVTHRLVGSFSAEPNSTNENYDVEYLQNYEKSQSNVFIKLLYFGNQKLMA